jgi:hypothetical protein
VHERRRGYLSLRLSGALDGPRQHGRAVHARYDGNGVDRIAFEGTAATGDNTEVRGVIELREGGPEATHVTLRQHLAPDTPVPRLLHGLVRSFVEREASDAVASYLANVKRALEQAA